MYPSELNKFNMFYKLLQNGYFKVKYDATSSTQISTAECTILPLPVNDVKRRDFSPDD